MQADRTHTPSYYHYNPEELVMHFSDHGTPTERTLAKMLLALNGNDLKGMQWQTHELPIAQDFKL